MREAIIAVILGVLISNCIRLDEDHCIINGGNAACEDEDICVMETRRVREIFVDGGGCVSESDIHQGFYDYFVSVPYGLPSHMGSVERPDDLRSLIGTLTYAADQRMVERDCVVNRQVVYSLEEDRRRVDEVRGFLDRSTRVRIDAAELSAAQVDAINDFSAAVDEKLSMCDVEPDSGSE